MKVIAKVLSLIVAGSLSAFAQTIWTSNKIEPYNGYDYELWNQDNSGTVKMTLTGDNGTGPNAKGGTFDAEWSNTCNVLFRSGKKWGPNSTQSHTDIGQITFDFAATWNSTDDVRYLGLYGWAYFKPDKVPTKRENGSTATFSNQIEWYIIQNRGSYNPTTNSDLCGTAKGEATINGVTYEFKVCDRIGQPMLTGNGNFKQFFSIPKSTSQHRTSGIIDASAHFNAWHNAGMYMDGPLYEVAMKIESYKCNNNQAQGSGTGSVTKNILTIGSTPPSSSSSSAGGGNSSSSGEAEVCGEYQPSFCGGMAFASVLDNSIAIPSTGECLFVGDFEVIQPALSSTVSINGVENTCGNDWNADNDDLGIGCPWNTKPSAKDGGYYVYVRTGTINSYENNGWQDVVAKTKPSCGPTPIAHYPQPVVNSKVPTYYTIKGEPVGSTKPVVPGVYFVKQGSSIQKIVVR